MTGMALHPLVLAVDDAHAAAREADRQSRLVLLVIPAVQARRGADRLRTVALLAARAADRLEDQADRLETT